MWAICGSRFATFRPPVWELEGSSGSGMGPFICGRFSNVDNFRRAVVDPTGVKVCTTASLCTNEDDDNDDAGVRRSSPKGGGRKVRFAIAVERLEIDENVNGACSVRQFLVLD